MLGGLTDPQRVAVEQTEGPVMVIAGPGTGKTHILTARIGKILQNTDTAPHNILCLTFTDAGVRAMRERLLQTIGPEAYRVHIFTFHGFCNNIIQNNLERFGKHDLEPVSELEILEILEEILTRLPPDHPLRLGRPNQPTYYLPHLRDLFARMKKENWTARDLHLAAHEFLQDLPNREEYLYKTNRGATKVGDLKTHLLERDQKRMRLLLAGADLYDKYLEGMAARGRYDYDDMILWTLEAFERDEDLLRTYQEQYLYFLVDEYQDTNGAQNDILHKLIRYWEQPNVFIVGDDDQSIYEFQGARLRNLEDFYSDYEEQLTTVILVDNFRSTQATLDGARQVIEHNDKRIINRLEKLGLRKDLKARHPQISQLPNQPLIVEYANPIQELTATVNDIAALIERGTDPEDIAVIYARHAQADDLQLLLERRRIPYTTRRPANALDLPVVQQLRRLLRYLHRETAEPYSGESDLYQILHYDFLGLLPEDIAAVSLHRATQKDAVLWRDLLRRPDLLPPLQRPEPWQQLDRLLKTLQPLVLNESPARLVERVINQSGLLTRALAPSTEGSEADQLYRRMRLMEPLHTFLDFVRSECRRRPRLSLEGLLLTLDSMDQARVRLPLLRPGEITPGVQLLTAHGSKGLEFKHVFLYNCLETSWGTGNAGGRNRFHLPDTLTYSGEEDPEEARRRLFYVALTRAREHVTISYPLYDGQRKKANERVRFVTELAESSSVRTTEGRVSQADLLETQRLLLLERPTLRVDLPKSALLDRMIGRHRMSVSSLNTYLRCPLSFYFRYVLRVPSIESEAARMGSIMHASLEILFGEMLKEEQHTFKIKQSFLEIFERELERSRAFFGSHQLPRLLERGRLSLGGYYETHRPEWTSKVELEKRISTEVEGVPIVGIIDRIDHRDVSTVHLVDYKTGRKYGYRMRRPTHKENDKAEFGGSYWRQLVFYKVLYENWSQSSKLVGSGEISYLEPDPDGLYQTDFMRITAQDARFMRDLMRSVYDRIQRHEFTDGCGEASCAWCGFLRQNPHLQAELPPASFSSIESEILDD